MDWIEKGTRQFSHTLHTFHVFANQKDHQMQKYSGESDYLEGMSRLHIKMKIKKMNTDVLFFSFIYWPGPVM